MEEIIIPGKAKFLSISDFEKALPFYLRGIGCRYTQEPVKRPHGYPAFQWIQCSHGEGQILIDNKTYSVKENQGMFLYPDIPHEYKAVKEPWIVDWIDFAGSQVTSICKLLQINNSCILNTTNSEILLAKMRQIYAIADSNNPTKQLECSAFIYDLLVTLHKHAFKPNDASMQNQFSKLQPVIEYIHLNYHRYITLEELAELIHVTPEHLCYLMKKFLKVRPFEYITNIRINKSKELLIDNRNLKIKEIARMVGYEDASYFCTVFKKFTGCSPGEFKRLFR